MATPVISNISVVYPNGSSLGPGERAEIHITASDPDARDVTVNLSVTDAAGNVGTGMVVVNVSDPISYEATVDSGSIVQDPARPHVFFFTA